MSDVLPFSPEKEVMRIISDLERDRQWREQNEYNTDKLDRWISRLMEHADRASDHVSMQTETITKLTRELLRTQEELKKARIILNYLHGNARGGARHFFERMEAEMTGDTLRKAIENSIDADYEQYGIIPTHFYSKQSLTAFCTRQGIDPADERLQGVEFLTI